MAVTGVSGASPTDRPEASAEREQVAHLAQEFEAMFISEMMRGMRQSLLSEEEDQGLGSATMTDTFDAEFGRSMSNAGGLGLARIMIEGLKKQLGDAGSTPGTPATPNPTAAVMATSISVVPNAASATVPMPTTMAAYAASAASAAAAISSSNAAQTASTTAAIPTTVTPRAASAARSALSVIAATTPSATPASATPPLDPVSASTIAPGADGDVDSAASSDGVEATAASPVPAQAAGPSAGVQFRTLPGPVTSKFGWRSDPFTGRPQFHAGTDIRLAYGHDVQSVAAGRVKSVGEQAGYGLTVVIDHGQGLETRYAHLSNASVKAGDVVDSGQVVARSGSSGRSTGPHLHLEARRNGRAVEMAALLKSPGVRADSYADDRTIVRSGHED